MKKTIIYLLAAILLLFPAKMFSQGTQNFQFGMMYFSTGKTQTSTVIINNTHPGGTGGAVNNHGTLQVTHRTDTVFERVCRVDLANAGAVAAIIVDAGTMNDSSDIFSHTYQFGDSLNLPDGMSYATEGSTLFLGLFETVQTDMYYFRVRLQDANGIISEPKYFY